MRAPLEGVTVLEVGVFLAAPYATMQLADLGARVVKVENPGVPDPVRATGPFVAGQSAPFARINRNKESVALDLKAPEGRAAFLRLVQRADVLVENLRPGAMRRLGLGPEELQRLNPALIYASASGWGQSGPLADRPGLDIMAQARGGLMSITGEPDGEPVKSGVPLADLTCALYVALAVTAALSARARDGVGEYIDVSLYESAVSLAVWEAGRFFTTGEVGGRLGSAHQSMAPYQAVRTADGHVTVGAVTPATWRAFCTSLDLPGLLEDERFRDASARHAARNELIPAIEEATTRRTTAEVVAVLDAAGVPCAPISDYREVFTDPHLVDRDFFWNGAHPTMGEVRQIGSPMRLTRTPARRDAAGPTLGSATRDVLAWAGLDAGEIEALIAGGVAAAPASAVDPIPDPVGAATDDRTPA